MKPPTYSRNVWRRFFFSPGSARCGGYIAVPVMFILVLLFCDITPKTFALGFPGGIATVTAPRSRR